MFNSANDYRIHLVGDMIAMYSTEDQLINYKFSLRHKGTIVSHVWISRQDRKIQNFLFNFHFVCLYVCLSICM